MKQFGGPVLFLDRDDINTDEIIPAKYLTEISKTALKPHLLEDLLVQGHQFDNSSKSLQQARVVITRANFGCGSSREHAVWAFEVNGIELIIAESFARIFRQNMFNCGIMAIELSQEQIAQLFAMKGNIDVAVNLETDTINATSDAIDQSEIVCTFTLNSFDKRLIESGGWLAYADKKY